MNRLLSLLIGGVVYFVFNPILLAQQDYVPGIVILNNQDTVRGEILQTLTEKSFKISVRNPGNPMISNYGPNDVSKIILNSGESFYSFFIESEPDSTMVFLKALILGKVSLFTYTDVDLRKRFFIRLQGEDLRELKYIKESIIDESGKRYIKHHKLYVGELYRALGDCKNPKMRDDIERTSFLEKPLIRLLSKYYACIGEKYESPYRSKSTSKGKLDIGVLIGATSMSEEKLNGISRFHYGLSVKYTLPNLNGRYAIETGYYRQFPKDTNNDQTTQRIPLILNRNSFISRHYSLSQRIGVDYATNYGLDAMNRERSIGLLLGMGQQIALKSPKLKFFLDIDFRFGNPKMFILSSGVRF